MAKVKIISPDKNVIYTFAMPPTGRLVRLKFLKEINDGQRISFQNVDQKNVVSFTPSRFTYLHSYCLVEKEKVKEEPKAPTVRVSDN